MLSVSSHTLFMPLTRGDDNSEVRPCLGGQPRAEDITSMPDGVVKSCGSLATASSKKYDSSPQSARTISSSKPEGQFQTPLVLSSDERVPQRKSRATKRSDLRKAKNTESSSPESIQKSKTGPMDDSNSSKSSDRSVRSGRMKKTSRTEDSSRRRRINKTREMDDSSRRRRQTDSTLKRSPIRKTLSSPRASTSTSKSRVPRATSEGMNARPRRTKSVGTTNRSNRPRSKRSNKPLSSPSPPPFELVRTFSEPRFDADPPPSEENVSGIKSSPDRLRKREVRVESKKRSPRRTKTNREGLPSGSHKQRRNQKELAKKQVQQALMHVASPEVFADKDPTEKDTELHHQDLLRQKKIQGLKEHNKGKETLDQTLKGELWSIFQGGPVKVKELALERAQSAVESARLAADRALTSVNGIRPKSTHQRTSYSGNTLLDGSNRSFRSASAHTRTPKVQAEHFG